MEHALDIMTNDRASLRDQLCEDDGRLRDRIELEGDIALLPQFTTLDTRRMVGTGDILAFVLSIPVDIAIGVAANVIYSWLTANRVKKIRLDTMEIVITDNKEQTVRLLIKSLEEQSTD